MATSKAKAESKKRKIDAFLTPRAHTNKMEKDDDENIDEHKQNNNEDDTDSFESDDTTCEYMGRRKVTNDDIVEILTHQYRRLHQPELLDQNETKRMIQKWNEEIGPSVHKSNVNQQQNSTTSKPDSTSTGRVLASESKVGTKATTAEIVHGAGPAPDSTLTMKGLAGGIMGKNNDTETPKIWCDGDKVTPATYQWSVIDHMKDILSSDTNTSQAANKNPGKGICKVDGYELPFAIFPKDEKWFKSRGENTQTWDTILNKLWENKCNIIMICPCKMGEGEICGFPLRCSRKYWSAIFLTKDREEPKDGKPFKRVTPKQTTLMKIDDLWLGNHMEWDTIKGNRITRDDRRNFARNLRKHLLQEWDTHKDLAMKLTILEPEQRRALKDWENNKRNYFLQQCEVFKTIKLPTDRQTGAIQRENTPNEKLPWVIWFENSIVRYCRGQLDASEMSNFVPCINIYRRLENENREECAICSANTVPHSGGEITLVTGKQMCGGCGQPVCVECVYSGYFSSGWNEIMDMNRCPKCRMNNMFDRKTLPPLNRDVATELLKKNMERALKSIQISYKETTKLSKDWQECNKKMELEISTGELTDETQDEMVKINEDIRTNINEMRKKIKHTQRCYKDELKYILTKNSTDTTNTAALTECMDHDKEIGTLARRVKRRFKGDFIKRLEEGKYFFEDDTDDEGEEC